MTHWPLQSTHERRCSNGKLLQITLYANFFSLTVKILQTVMIDSLVCLEMSLYDYLGPFLMTAGLMLCFVNYCQFLPSCRKECQTPQQFLDNSMHLHHIEDPHLFRVKLHQKTSSFGQTPIFRVILLDLDYFKFELS